MSRPLPSPRQKRQTKKYVSFSSFFNFDTDVFQAKTSAVTKPAVKWAGPLVRRTAPKKGGKVMAPFVPLLEKEYEEMRAKFYDEPTQEDLGAVFEAGLANGTLIADEDEDPLDFEYPEEPDSVRFDLFGKQLHSQ